MTESLDAILDHLPPKRRHSKLEPHAALIHELRHLGRSYRDIVTLLHDHCGMRVGLHTVYNFVRVRARKDVGTPRERHPRPRAGQSISQRARSAPRPDTKTDAWARIAAVKARRASAVAPDAKEFAFDETRPLELVETATPKKE